MVVQGGRGARHGVRDGGDDGVDGGSQRSKFRPHEQGSHEDPQETVRRIMKKTQKIPR